MRRKWLFGLFTVITVWPVLSRAESLEKDIKKAVERSTLAQSGTKPFHLKATFAPSFERDKDSGRTGEVEIWWDSPTRWKREVRSPGFQETSGTSCGGEEHRQRWAEVDDFEPAEGRTLVSSRFCRERPDPLVALNFKHFRRNISSRR